MKFAIVRSLLSLVLLPSITVACGGGGMANVASKPPVVTTPPPDPPPSSAPPIPSKWTATDLAPLSGMDAAQANAVNNFGHAVGYSVGNGIAHATLWRNGMAIDFGPNSYANGINDLDQIVGYVLGDSGLPHAELWPDSIDLGSISGYDSFVATGINNSATVVGIAYSSANSSLQTAFMWTRTDGMRSVKGCASAEAINDSGDISGVATNLDAAICNVQNFGMQGAATALNSLSQAAGFSGNDAWLFPGTDLGATLATGINDYGWVVGYKVVSSGGMARVQSKAQAHIHRLTPKVSGTSLPWIWSAASGTVMLPGITTANAINQSGQIVGAQVMSDGSTHGVLLEGK